MTTDGAIPPALDGATTALHRRIEELTAESIEAHRLLELERAKDGDTWKERALTERAAREKEKLVEAAQYKALLGRALQAERERDAALARVAEVTEQRDLWAKQCNLASEAQADAASKLSTALAALKVGTSREVVAHAETLGKLLAAEIALASARELLSEARETMTDEEEPLRSNMDAWLSSAPSPAPCSGCAAARELIAACAGDRADGTPIVTADLQEPLDAWLKEHP